MILGAVGSVSRVMNMTADPDHAGALTALLYLPVVLVTLAVAADRLAAAGFESARRLVANYRAAPASRRLVALLLAVTASIHAGLVPGHLAGDPVLAGLFALDAVVLTVATLAAFARRLPLWRTAVAILLVANLAAYLAYVLTGVESADVIGVATKAIEAIALAVVIHPSSGFVTIRERGVTRFVINTTRRTVQ